jgi:hypothetical protein
MDVAPELDGWKVVVCSKASWTTPCIVIATDGHANPSRQENDRCAPPAEVDGAFWRDEPYNAGLADR